MPNAPRKNAEGVSTTTYNKLASYISERAEAANLSRSQLVSMILVRWAMEGAPPVDRNDLLHITPGLSLRAHEIGKDAIAWHGWKNFIEPTPTGAAVTDFMPEPMVADGSTAAYEIARAKERHAQITGKNKRASRGNVG